MNESRPLADQRYREEVLRARKMTPEEKFLAGEELFHLECQKALAEIRAENPEFSEEDCRRELERRLELQDRAEWEEVINRQRQRSEASNAGSSETNQARPQSAP